MHTGKKNEKLVKSIPSIVLAILIWDELNIKLHEKENNIQKISNNLNDMKLFSVVHVPQRTAIKWKQPNQCLFFMKTLNVQKAFV